MTRGKRKGWNEKEKRMRKTKGKSRIKEEIYTNGPKCNSLIY
jgi:hypothetical protein